MPPRKGKKKIVDALADSLTDKLASTQEDETASTTPRTDSTAANEEVKEEESVPQQ